MWEDRDDDGLRGGLPRLELYIDGIQKSGNKQIEKEVKDPSNKHEKDKIGIKLKKDRRVKKEKWRKGKNDEIERE